MPPKIGKFSQFLVRISAFLFKEILEIIRQPLLIITLVLGPFLILLFFGIGFRNEARALRTLFVVDPNSGMAQAIEQYANSLGPQLVFVGITDSMEEARQRLQRGEIDLITEVPADAYQTILNNQQAVFRLYHRELDPFQADYINVFGRVYVDEINRRILRFITTASQLDVSQAQKKLDATRSTIYTLRTILQECAGQPDRPVTCDREKLHQYLQTLDRNIDEFTQTTDRTLTLADAVEEGLAGSEPSAVQPQPNLVEEANSLSDVGETVQDYRDALETLTRLETDLDQMESKLNLFLDIDPIILISPFRAEVQNVSLVPIKVTDYFSPAVIILLLQHLTVTFAALSMVRERRLGAMELFYVSPLSPLETLLGKYLSYLTFGGVVASVLVALVALALGAPVLGSWLNVALVILGVLFTSLGIGFVISLVSKTDTEAVQYAMIILLTSVFFSGFLLGLQTLWAPVRIISWMLPATYGIALLREIMLRGDPPTANVFIQLVTIGLGLFIVAWYLLRRSMTQS